MRAVIGRVNNLTFSILGTFNTCTQHQSQPLFVHNIIRTINSAYLMQQHFHSQMNAAQQPTTTSRAQLV